MHQVQHLACQTPEIETSKPITQFHEHEFAGHFARALLFKRTLQCGSPRVISVIAVQESDEKNVSTKTWFGSFMDHRTPRVCIEVAR